MFMKTLIMISKAVALDGSRITASRRNSLRLTVPVPARNEAPVREGHTQPGALFSPDVVV